MSRSIVQYYAEHESYRCGYCRSPDTNFSHGMWAHTMTVSDYQDLIDRGWRRSGKYCYKPTMDVTCCPMYTIRCRALEFKASKSQKKILKRLNKYLTGDGSHEVQSGDASRKMSTCSNDTDFLGEGFDEGIEQFVETTRDHQDINIKEVTNAIDMSNVSEEQEVKCKDQPALQLHASQKTMVTLHQEKSVKKVLGPDPNKAQCKKAKQMRRERKLEKLMDKGIEVTSLNNSNKNKEKQLEDFINELPDDVKQKLEIKLVRTTPPSPEWLATAKVTHEVYLKYQMVIHGDKPEKCTESKFSEFLVQSPLLEEYKTNGPRCGYGSFHQQYWYNGKIIAVGVIDILPRCVSSVYFFYDPQYRHLTLGTYGALREIEFTRCLHSQSPDLKYYYLGFYIHSCRKMRYKGNFHPSDLLCPETYNWFPIKECVPKLEASPYSRLDPNIDNVDDNYPRKKDIDCIPLWINARVISYGMCKKKNDNPEALYEYARLVGAKSAKNLILAGIPD